MSRSLQSWVLQNQRTRARISHAESEVERRSPQCDYCGKFTAMRNLTRFGGGLLLCPKCKKFHFEKNLRRRNPE